MSIELGLLRGGIATGTNTHYAPLSAYYQRQQRLNPLENLTLDMKTMHYSLVKNPAKHMAV